MYLCSSNGKGKPYLFESYNLSIIYWRMFVYLCRRHHHDWVWWMRVNVWHCWSINGIQLAESLWEANHLRIYATTGRQGAFSRESSILFELTNTSITKDTCKTHTHTHTQWWTLVLRLCQIPEVSCMHGFFTRSHVRFARCEYIQECLCLFLIHV